MNDKNTMNNVENDELSITSMLESIKVVLLFIKNHFLVLIVFCLMGSGIGLYLVLSSKPVYSAKIQFIMKETNSGAGIMSSLGNLGSLFGGASPTSSLMDRTLAIAVSERVIGAVLMKETSIGNKSDLFINHFIKIEGLHKSWADDDELQGILFQKDKSNIEGLSTRHRKAYKAILSYFIKPKSKLIEKSFDKKSGVFELIANYSNEEFSIKFISTLYNELENFLYSQSVISSSNNVIILEKKIDSIKTELNVVQNSLARNTDRTLGLLMQEDKVDQKKLLMKEQMLSIMYGEAQRNLESFRFMNQSISPGLELLATPFSPLLPSQSSKLIYLFIGFFSGGLIGIGILLLQKVFM